MTKMAIFTFNAFQENTYLLWNADSEAVLIDPGMSNLEEQTLLETFRRKQGLTIKRLLLTHAHIDHVLGLSYACDQYQLTPELHEPERVVYDAQPQVAAMYGLHLEALPSDVKYVDLEKPWTMGDLSLDLRFTPGHSPGSISLVNHASHYVIAGDALFAGSIGRTDLPGGDFPTLIESIQRELFSLPDDMRVYSGHGPDTTIGTEKTSNPFFQ